MAEFAKFEMISHRNPRDDFREWWLRAALAMGHSKWLEEEMLEISCEFQPWSGL
jgi:hypothetical protein